MAPEAEGIARILPEKSFVVDLGRLQYALREGIIEPAEVPNLGLRAIEAGKVSAAHNIFELLVDLYLNSNPNGERAVPHEIGAEAMAQLAAVSRAKEFQPLLHRCKRWPDGKEAIPGHPAC